ncbi:YpzG family protein [Tuberibacillus sp. Marseille-P3662]|uniref:YpzG family protein n=1 Tax=Tuberibacillus sp. Marseille-P3662 TaxID=1965358 RepID=UPI000A1CDF15|nr:YpzG family protein [Tuberibacillus sp. Marseille-P3662]
MGKGKSKAFAEQFKSPRANPKRASNQVNGETAPTQQDKIMAIYTQTRVPFK